MFKRRQYLACSCLVIVSFLVAPSLAETNASARLKEILAGDTPKNIDDLKVLETRLQEVSKKVIPSTVGVQLGGGSGSGVIISEDGYVLTAGHVSGQKGRKVTLILSDGRRVQGKTLGANHGIDSGLIKIDGDEKWPFCEMGKSGDLKKGTWCIATGHPGGFQKGRQSPVRVGRVLEVSKRAIVTSCMLVGGDSGGPVFDADGKVIGINSRIGDSSAANLHVPIDTFHQTWDRLAKGEVWGGRSSGPRRGGPFIGVAADPNSKVAKIESVVEGSPAEKAGIQPGDVIIKFAGKHISDFASLAKTVGSKKPGNEVEVVVKRGDKELKLKMKIGKYGG